MKKFYFCIAAMFAAVALSAQPGGFGGPGMGAPMGGGMGMSGAGFDMSSFDPFENIRPEYAEKKTAELAEALGLTEKQAKKVKSVYSHSDTGLGKEMMEIMSMMSAGQPGGQGGFGMGMPGGIPGGFGQGMPGGAPGNFKADTTAAKDNAQKQVPNQGRPGGQGASGQPGGMPGGQGASGQPGGMPGGFGQGMPGGMGFPGMPQMGADGKRAVPDYLPVSNDEKIWREKKMSKILTPEQFELWKSIEAKNNRFPGRRSE